MDEELIPTDAIESEIISPTIYIPKKNVIIDSQIFSTFQGCARLCDFRFNHHLVSIYGKSKSLEMGSIVHVFMEYYYKAIIAGHFKSVAFEQGMEAASQYAKSPEVKNTALDDRQWALKTCEQYIAHYKNDHWVPLEIEKVKGRIIYEDDEIRVLWKSKFDMITDTNQGIYPVDHKTMSQRRDTLSLNNQFKGQCVVQGTRGIFINKIGFQTSLKPEEKFTRAMISYSRDQLIEWQSVTVPFYAKLMIAYAENGYWPPNYNHCENKYGFCQFKDVCKADRNMREEELRKSFIVGDKWDVTNVKEIEG
jgi:hypothetical protein